MECDFVQHCFLSKAQEYVMSVKVTTINTDVVTGCVHGVI